MCESSIWPISYFYYFCQSRSQFDKGFIIFLLRNNQEDNTLSSCCIFTGYFHALLFIPVNRCCLKKWFLNKVYLLNCLAQRLQPGETAWLLPKAEQTACQQL